MRSNSRRHPGLGRRWLLAALVVSAAVAPSLGQMRRPEKGSLEVVADRTAYEAGADARLAAVMAIESNWHTNSHKPTYDYLIGPTSVSSFPMAGRRPRSTTPMAR